MQEAAITKDLQLFNRLNVQFHREFGVAAGNAYLARLLGTVEVAMRRFGTRSYSNTRLSEILDEHEAVLEAIEQRDADLAAQAAESHAAQAKESTVKQLLRGA